MSTAASTNQIENLQKDQKPGLTVRTIRPDERQTQIIGLLEEVMGAGSGHWATRDLWQWKHVDNPFGSSLVLISEAEDGRIAGLRSFMRWRFRVSGCTIEAVRPVDTATHPDFRRLGIFRTLTLQALEEARSNGTGLVFNTPNDMSIGGYLKMGWSSVGEFVPTVKVRSYPALGVAILKDAVRRRLRRNANSEPDQQTVPDSLLPKYQINEEITDLVEHDLDMDRDRIVTDKSVDYLLWRYGANPLYDHAVFKESEAGRVTGVAIVRPSESRGLRTLVFEEFIVPERTEAIVGRLVQAAYDCFKPHSGSAFANSRGRTGEALVQTGFGRKSRSSFNFVVNQIDESLQIDASSPDNWGIQLSEVELF